MKSFNLASLGDSKRSNVKLFEAYFVAGLTWYAARSFSKTDYDGIIIVVIAILCGASFYRLKDKLRIKNDIWRAVAAFLIIEAAGGFLIGVLTTLI